MPQASMGGPARSWRNITPFTLLQLNAPQRMLLAVIGTAVILVSAIVYTTMLLRPGPEPAAYKSIRDVSVVHLQKAFEDLVKHQDALCQQLRELQDHLAAAYKMGGRKPTVVQPKSTSKWAMQPAFNLSADGVVLASLFRSMEDPIYKAHRGSESRTMDDSATFGYMDLWYTTISAQRLPAVVFHDGLSPAFVARYTTEHIKFIHVAGVGETSLYSVNDVRFDIFFDWLQCCADVDHVLMSDVRDTRFARDPFELMRRGNLQYQLFTNTDRNNDWMGQRFKEVNLTRPALQVMLNDGVWGGSKAAVQDVLAGMLALFRQTYTTLVTLGNTKLRNFNMAVYNTVVLNEAARSWQIFTGVPFCAGQVACEIFFQCEFAIYHKSIQPGELPPCGALPLGPLMQMHTSRPMLWHQR